MKNEQTAITVKALITYPFKSCRGISLSSSGVTKHGFDLDRRFVIVDAESHGFIQSHHRQKLSLVTTLITKEGEFGSFGVYTEKMGLCFIQPSRKPDSIMRITVQKTTIAGHDQGDSIADWFSTYLGTSCRVVVIWHEMPKKKVGADLITIAGHDSSPVHLINEASLTRMGQVITGQDNLYNVLTPERFRPNIIVGGAPAFEEEKWGDLQVGNGHLRLRTRKNTPRCYMTLVNPITGEIDAEPLRTFKKFRSNSGEAEFGTYLYPVSTGHISVGDIITPF